MTEVLSEALGALALEGTLTTLGYSASRKTTIDVTNLIVPQASIRGLNMFSQPAMEGLRWFCHTGATGSPRRSQCLSHHCKLRISA
jgi:D-arabinose 1-dehydrogenase-like Zn-dependent alcohol dehydrogenase